MQFNFITSNEARTDFEMFPDNIMRVTDQDKEGNNITLTRVELSTRGMNILSFRNAKKMDRTVQLGNYFTRKFLSFSILVFLKRGDYRSAEEVPLNDLLNSDLYFELPLITFEDGGMTRKARCVLAEKGKKTEDLRSWKSGVRPESVVKEGTQNGEQGTQVQTKNGSRNRLIIR